MKASTFFATTLAAWATLHGAHAAEASPSRAEVRAELLIWRQSGLADLAQQEVPPHTTREYLAATARYEALRRSPAFAELVRSLGGAQAQTLATRTPAPAR